MPNTILSIDQYSVVSWDKYLVVTVFSHLMPHHITLLQECFQKRQDTKGMPLILDCVRLPEASLREKELLVSLRNEFSQYMVLSNISLNQSLQKFGVYHLIPTSTNFKSALGTFGIEYQPKLDAKFVNTFVESTVKVFFVQTGEAPLVGKPIAQKSPILSDLFGIIPTNSSHFSGSVLLSFNDETLRDIFIEVYKYEPEKIKCETEGFLSDILELIHETTRTELVDKGFIFYPSTASVVRDGNLSDHISKNQVFLNVPLIYKNKIFQMCIGVEGI